MPQKPKTVSAFPPDLPAMLIRGEVTVGDIFGLDRDSLYQIANIGYDLLNSGNLREAKAIYAGLVAADPYDSVFHCHLAAVHHRLGEIAEALSEYESALRLNWANVDALVGRGEIRLSCSKWMSGVDDLRKAIEYDPEVKRESTARARLLLQALNKRRSQ